MPDITIEEKHQKIIEQLNEGLKLDPPYLMEFMVSNIVQRVLSYLLGWDYVSGKPVKIGCLADGTLKVAPTGGGYEHCNRMYDVAGDTWGADRIFTHVCSRVDIWVWDADIDFERKPPDGIYEGPIWIPKNMMYSFDCITRMFRVKNHTPGQTATFQVVGWY